MKRIWMIAMAAAFAASSAGCASNARSGEAADTASAFSGTWAVRWCNKARPDLECGGFWVTLVQTGQHVCGEYDGALVNLRQIDDGRVTGLADGDSAILQVRSHRNESILEVEARRKGAELHWTAGRELERGSGDVSIIALNDVLERRPDTALRSPEACRL